VGYAGGSKSNPTYHSLGNHSETIQIDYDPTQITYEELLDIFWNEHSPTSRAYSRQYASIIFTHDDEQRRLALETKARQEAERGQTIYTEIVPFTEFWLAEDYHQKYRLRQNRDLVGEFTALYPDLDGFVNSTATARVNGYLGGNGTLAQFEAEIDDLGLSAEAREYLEEIARGRLR
jgi:peptide-methionine (S)-S-oxide reductase